MLNKISWLWDAGPPKEEEPPKKKIDKFSLMSENVQKIHKNLELQKEISKLTQIIEDQQVQINELQRQVGTSSISILNPQNNRYYHSQEEIQDFVNKLYGLYKTGTRRVNQLMEEKL